MNYVRLQTGKDGQSHFSEAALDLDEADYRPPAPMMFVSHAFETAGLQFLRLPSGWAAETINPPKKQFLICLKGRLEVTASDGEKRSFGPGDRVLMEDVEGKGHRSAVMGADECLAAVIPID
jgi:quercetin dioxygenase-like cupin family protein